MVLFRYEGTENFLFEGYLHSDSRERNAVVFLSKFTMQFQPDYVIKAQ